MSYKKIEKFEILWNKEKWKWDEFGWAKLRVEDSNECPNSFLGILYKKKKKKKKRKWIKIKKILNEGKSRKKERISFQFSMHFFNKLINKFL